LTCEFRQATGTTTVLDATWTIASAITATRTGSFGAIAIPQSADLKATEMSSADCMKFTKWAIARNAKSRHAVEKLNAASRLEMRDAT